MAGANLDIGRWKLPLALSIATLKAGLVTVIFMELFQAGTCARIAVMAGLSWLTLTSSRIFEDEAARPHSPPGFSAGVH